jgi:hypothetical protein
MACIVPGFEKEPQSLEKITFNGVPLSGAAVEGRDIHFCRCLVHAGK